MAKGDQQGPEQYQYDSLGEQEKLIRLLDLHQTRDGLLECTITQVPLSQGGYQALSYEWGSPEAPFQVIVRDEVNNRRGYILVTANLRDSLRDLRDAPEVEPKRFWIDQICINQEDDDEKGRQVQLMAEIYRNASQVITYLGPRSESVEEENHALHLFARLDQYFKPNCSVFSKKTPRELSMDSDSVPVRDLPDSITEDDPGWTLLLHIIYGGWMRRLWMLQENILCPKTVMLRGTRLLDWLSVAAIPILFYTECLPIELLHRHWSGLAFNCSPRAVNSHVHRRWMTRMLRYHDEEKLFKFTELDENITWYEYLDCKDPRDRIYALLGMSSNTEHLGIVPSYRRTEDEVFMDASIRIYLNDKGGLYMLRHLGYLDTLGSSNATKPSWAYRPGVTAEHPLLSYSPHPSRLANARFESNNTTMVLRGRKVDRIEFASSAVPYPKGDDEGDTLSDEWAVVIKQVLSNLTAVLEYLRVNLQNTAALLHALVGNSKWPSSDDPADVSYFLWCYMIRQAAHLIKYSEHKSAKQRPYPDSVAKVLANIANILKGQGRVIYDDPRDATDDSIIELSNDVLVRAIYLGRSLCVSQQGRICVATGRAQEGDEIALFAGGDSAYVIRSAEGGFRYIGTAYVLGIMDGEVYEGVPPKEIDDEIRLV